MNALTDEQRHTLAILHGEDIGRPVNHRDVYLEDGGDIYAGSNYLGWFDRATEEAVYDRYTPWKYVLPDGTHYTA
jgi:hypothetical protein